MPDTPPIDPDAAERAPTRATFSRARGSALVALVTALVLAVSACLQQRGAERGPAAASPRFADLGARPLPERLRAPPGPVGGASGTTETAAGPVLAPLARLELAAPARSPFLLRATLPVPRGALEWTSDEPDDGDGPAASRGVLDATEHTPDANDDTLDATSDAPDTPSDAHDAIGAPDDAAGDVADSAGGVSVAPTETPGAATPLVRSPLGIVSHDAARTIVPAQVEVVTRGPDGTPEVVEILARVELAPSERAGSRVRFAVVDLRARAEQSALPELAPTERVRALLDPSAAAPLRLRTTDVYGNRYEADLRGGADAPGVAAVRTLKDGAWLRQRRVASVLVPTERSGEGEPLPHLMGVHAYVSELAGEDRAVLELRVHNGLSAGSREPAPEESPSGIVYWRSLELVLPRGWVVEPFVADPFFGPPREEGEHAIVPIVRANEDGSLHMMGPQMQMHRRLVLRPAPAAERAPSAVAFFDGLAFPLAEPSLWSWAAPETPYYFPQHSVLARWDAFARSGHAGVGGLRALLASELDALADLVARGGANGDDVVATVMGWAHPWFYKYGGSTGGAGIQFFEGHQAAGAASAHGYARIALVHQMNASRQDEAAWTRDGEPVGVERWLDAGSGRVPVDFRTHGGMLPTEFRLPAHGGPPASEQVLEVHRRNLRPFYDQGAPHVPKGEYPPATDNLLAWAPHDGQHMVRYTKNTKALVWLGNDSLAKDDLLLSAELFHLQLHEHEGPTPDGVTLRAFERHVEAFPHQGAWIGRDQAWGIDSMCATYALASDEWRAAHQDWFRRVARMLHGAAMPGGIVQRNSNPKVLGREGYDASQTFESEFLLHAMRCMNETVFRGVDPESFALLEDLVRRGVDYLFFGPVWREGPGRDPSGPLVGGPSTGFAVALSDGYAEPPFSDTKRWGDRYMPEDGLAPNMESFYGWQALEYAARLTQSSDGAGLENRYLARALRYGTFKRTFPALLEDLWASTVRRTSDTSSSWIGFAGYVQSLAP